MIWLMFLIACALVVLFTGLFFRTGRWSALLVAALWFACMSYEGLIYLHVLCEGDCNIRVDLLILWPVLFVVTVAVIFNVLKSRAMQKRRQADSSPTAE